MQDSEIASLKRSLLSFISRVANKYGDGEQPGPATVKRLEDNYRKLYEKYCKLDEKIIHQNFTADQIRVINFLSLGKENARQFYLEVADFFSEDANKTAIAVAHFVKSRRAYDLVNKADRKAAEDAELAQMFGSLLGVQVTSKFVASLRAEEMGRIIGYALSGLCEEDMRRWNDPQTSRHLRKEHGSLDEYLRHTIRKEDKWASYRFENRLAEEGRFLAALKINEFEGALDGKLRGRNVVDHCFVKHNHDGTGVITLGTSTTKILAEEHGYSFAQPILAAQALVRQKTINGEPNPYYGYEVQSYCFLAGHMPTTTLEGDLAKPPLVKMLEAGRSESQPKLTAKQIMELGWLPFFSLLASTNPSPIVGRGLESINPMISGCDTLPLYGQQINENRQKRVYSNSRRLAGMTMGWVSRMAALLAQDNTVIDLGATGPQKSLQPLLETLLKLTSNHFKNFPIQDNQSLSTAEAQSLQRTGNAFAKIAEKMKSNSSHLRMDLAGQFEEEAERLTTKSLLSRRIKRDSQWCAKFDQDPVYSDALHEGIDSLRHYDSGERLTAVATSLQEKIASNAAPALFKKVFIEIDRQLENMELTDKEQNFWSDYKDCLVYALRDGSNKEWVGANYKSWDSLHNDRRAFPALFPDHPAAKLIKATSALIGQKSPSGANPLSSRLEYPAVQKCLKSTSKALVALARDLASDSLVAELRNMGDKPRISKSARGMRR